MAVNVLIWKKQLSSPHFKSIFWFYVTLKLTSIFKIYLILNKLKKYNRIYFKLKVRISNPSTKTSIQRKEISIQSEYGFSVRAVGPAERDVMEVRQVEGSINMSITLKAIRMRK